jgi:hypothetical protein
MPQIEELEKLVLEKEKQREIEVAALQSTVEGKEADALTLGAEPQSDIVRKPLAFAQGANRGVAGLAGMPVDLLNSGLGLLGMGGDQPVMGGEWIQENIMPEPAMQERGFVERGLARVGEEFGAGAIPLLGIMNKVKKTAGVIEAGTRTPGIIRQLIDDLAKIPIPKLMKLETAAATGAGAGGFGAEQMFPDNPTAEMFGQLLGALGPEGFRNILSLARRRAMGGAIPAMSKEGVKERVARTLDDMARESPDFERQLETSLEMQAEFPEMQLTLPEATMSSEAAYLQKRLGQVSPGLADEVALTQGLRNKEMRNAMSASLHIGLDASEESIMNALRNRMQLLDRKLNGSIAAAQEKINLKAAQIKEDLNPEEVGEIIRHELFDKVRQWREQSAIYFRAIDPDNKVTLEPEPIAKAVQDIYRTWGDTAEGVETMPGIIRRVGNLIMDEQALAATPLNELLEMRQLPVRDISFNNLIKIRSDVLRVKREIRGGLSEYTGLKMRKLNQLFGAIEETMAQVLTDPRNAYWGPGTVERYRMAAQFYRSGVERLQRGTMQTIQRMVRQEPLKADVQVAGEILKSGKIGQKRANDFIRALGDNEKANEALLQYSLNEIYDVATREVAGELQVVPKRMREWLRQHKQALEYFPKIRGELEDVAGLEKRLAQLKDRKMRTLDARHKGALQLFLQGAEPLDVMKGLLKSPRGPIQLKQIVRKVRGDEDAIKGLRKAFFEAMAESFEGSAYDRFGNLKVNPRTARRFLDSKKGFLRQLYTAPELKALDKWVSAQERMIRAGELTPSEIKINVLDDPWEINKSWILSRWWNVKRRIIGKKYVVSEALFRLADAKAKAFQRREAAKLLREALFDPRIAQDLILYARPGKQTTVYKRLRAHLANLGGADRFEEDKEYDVKITGGIPNQD